MFKELKGAQKRVAMLSKYLLAYDDGNMILKMKDTESGLFEKFDRAEKKWIPDVEIARCFFGDMPTRPLTDNEAKELTGGYL